MDVFKDTLFHEVHISDQVEDKNTESGILQITLCCGFSGFSDNSSRHGLQLFYFIFLKRRFSSVPNSSNSQKNMC